MELSLIPNQKRITFYIERLIYGVVVAMPLQPMVGDVLLWLAIGLALYDLISSKSLSLPTGYLSWSVMIFVVWTGLSSIVSENWDWSIQSWFYQIVASGGMYYLVRTYIQRLNSGTISSCLARYCSSSVYHRCLSICICS